MDITAMMNKQLELLDALEKLLNKERTSEAALAVTKEFGEDAFTVLEEYVDEMTQAARIAIAIEAADKKHPAIKKPAEIKKPGKAPDPAPTPEPDDDALDFLD